MTAGAAVFITLLALVLSRVLPAERAIGYIAYVDRNPDIYLLDLSRGTRYNLTHNDAVNGAFAWSPDGQWLVFESNIHFSTQLYLVRTGCGSLLGDCGSGIRQLTGGATDSRRPVWSPDGTKIAYVYDVSFSDNDNEIYVMDVQSGQRWDVSHHSADDSMPAWSPDGRQLAFLSDRDGNYEIYTVDFDGANIRRLTNSDAFDSSPAWTPDGKRIAYVSMPRGQPIPEIRVMNADGSGSYRLFTRGTTDIRPWAGDSTRLLLQSSYAGANDLYLVNVDSRDVRILTGERFPELQMVWSPVWSPDDRQIAFVSASANAPGDIFVLDAAATTLRRLTYTGAGSPVWWP